MILRGEFLPEVAVAAWGAGAFASALALAWLRRRAERFGPAREAMVAAIAFTGIWALSGAWTGIGSNLTAFAEILRNLGWLFALYRLFGIDGRDASVTPVRPLVFALVFVELLQGAMRLFLPEVEGHPGLVLVSFRTLVTLRLLVATGGLVLTHNLYVGASVATRERVRWQAAALALLWGFDLNFFTIAYLINVAPHALSAARGGLALPVAALVALAARRGNGALRLSPSRAMAFQSVSLMLIGGYLLAMVAVAQWLAFVGGDFAAAMQIAFVGAASIVALLLLPSPRLRGWLRVTVTKHLFQHRYDYRAEWLRFTQTIGRGGGDESPLAERVIRALADIADSPAGLLLTPADDGRFELGGRWQWPTAEVPAEALAGPAARALERAAVIADLDALRWGRPDRTPREAIPAWLLAEPRAWAVIPLLHFERMVGVVVLARPAHARQLDWEDFDLLRVVGQQLASYLAEHAGQAALAEAGRFDEFNRRIAFVMHDIKNLASQMTLLARNADLHAENPAFRADMLVTLRNSAEKLNALLQRLSRYTPVQAGARGEAQADAIAAAVVERFRTQHRVELVERCDCKVSGQADALEQVLVHLVQNAIDASSPEAPIFVRVASEGGHGLIEVLDNGSGMSPEFVRTRLFRPFDSSKPGGFGIGAYEARELVRAMGGRLEVESREGFGSRFTIRLPLAETAELIRALPAEPARAGHEGKAA